MWRPLKDGWASVLPEDKITMFLEANKDLGWSVCNFDSKMESKTVRLKATHKKLLKKMEAKSKKKEEKKKKRKKRESSDSDSGSESDENMVDVGMFKRGEQISIVDNEGVPLAHGTCVDNEPEVKEFFHDHPLVDSLHKVSRYWKKIELTCMVKGSDQFTVDRDSIFTSEHDDENILRAKSLLEKERRLHNIIQSDKTFTIWHQYVSKRIRNTEVSDKHGVTPRDQGKSKKKTSKKARKR